MSHWYSKPRPRQHNHHVLTYYRARKNLVTNGSNS